MMKRFVEFMSWCFEDELPGVPAFVLCVLTLVLFAWGVIIIMSWLGSSLSWFVGVGVVAALWALLWVIWRGSEER